MALREGSTQASVPLPQGGGAQESVGQNFEVDLATGSGSYRLPLIFPPGPRQGKPELSLVYSTGHGNDLLGVGWSLGTPSISRSLIGGQPAFDDARDTFAYGGQQLVPVGGGRFRQEVEKDFSRIERVGEGWEVRQKDGTLMRFGTTPEHRLALPLERPDPVLQWLLESVEDSLGNRISYEYAQDVDKGHARLSGISYGPYIIRLVYDERPDPITSYRFGVERTLRHRLSEVRLLLSEGADEQPVKAYRFGYEQAEHNGTSRLISVRMIAFDTSASPPVEDAQLPFLFRYSDLTPEAATLRPLSNRYGALPPKVAEAGLTLMDVDGIGLPGFLHISESGGHYWPNLGQLEVGAARQLRRFPTALARQPEQMRIASLSGHGLLDLIVMNGQGGGYYALNPGGEWETFRPFRHPPAVPITGARTIFMDLDFDGRADLLYADERAFYAVINRGGGDFDRPRVIRRVRDRSIFPDIDLSDPHVHIAGMTGDGSALVEVRDRSVTYWPSLGYGRFGAAVQMDSPPDLPADYDTHRLFLTDVDGDGLTDVVYVEQGQVLCWFNQSGRSFSAPVIIKQTPPSTALSVLMVDLLGQGQQGLLWSGERPLGGHGTHYFLNLTGEQKANLLVSITSPRGAEARITYGTSVDEAVRERATEDAAYLPFPVQVVRRIESEDHHTGATVATEYKYHRGYYDRRLRRFIGFGRVEQRDIGDQETPDRITVTSFHTRPPRHATQDALRRHAALARMPFRVEVFGADDGASKPFWVQNIDGEAIPVAVGLNGQQIFFAARRRTQKIVTERGTRSLELSVVYQYDEFGNVTREESTQRFIDGLDAEQVMTRSTSTRYVDETAAYLVGLPALMVERDEENRVVGASRLFYDGPPFEGLPQGQATRGVLTRREVLNFTDDMFAEVYGDEPPALASLGYFHLDDPELGPGWWSVELAQEIDARGNPLRRRDPRGHLTEFVFDSHGIYPTRVTDALGQRVDFEFDYRHGQMTRQVTPDGMETRWAFDPRGQLMHVIRPQDVDGQPSIFYEHAPFASPPRLTIKQRAVTGATDLEVRHLYYDARGAQIQSRLVLTDQQVVVSATPLDFCRGLTTREQGGYFASATAFSSADAPSDVTASDRRRDALDRVIQSVSPGGGRSRWRYEAGLTHYFDAEDTDPASQHFDTPRSEYVDAYGRCVAVVERLTPTSARRTLYRRNAAGLLVEAIDHLGSRIFTQRYDLTGRLVGISHREAGEYRFVLDPAGNRLEERRGSQRLFRSFDALGRVTDVRQGSAESSPIESYIYDTGAGENLTGRLARVEGGFGSVAYSYTRCGRVKAKTRTFPNRPGESFTILYKYDRQGRTLNVTYPNGHVVELGYDRSGQPKSVSGVIANVDYDPHGYLKRVAYTNGVETSYAYDAMPGRLSMLRTLGPDEQSYQHYLYTYDAVGNPLEIEDKATVAGHVRHQRRYTYDSLYHLTGATGRDAAGDYEHHYQYDASGNLLTRPEVTADFTLTYQGERVVGSSLGESFSYDDAGNLTALDGWSHAFDARGRLAESIHKDGSRITMRYDHAGTCVSQLVEEADGAVRRTDFCDELFAVNEDSSSESYIYFNNHRVAALRSDGDDHIMHLDPLGNPDCFSRLGNGLHSGQLIYYPYGGVSLEMSFGARSPARFGNHPDIPGTGLVNFGVRAYSPRLGRFLQPDPVVVLEAERSIKMPRALHTYAYVIGNPVTLTDPVGANILDDAAGWFNNEVLTPVYNAGKSAVEGAKKLWEGAKDVGGKIWEGVKWGAGVVWEGIKYLGQAVAFIGTWGLAIADVMITWINPLNWLALGLDNVDNPNWFTNGLSFVIKFMRSPLTSIISIGFGLYGLATGKVKHVTMEKGMLAFEYDPEAQGFDATTFGATVHIRKGRATNINMEHEAYHSYQYASYGDAFIPVYAATGGWGVLSSLMAGKQKGQEHWWGCGFGVSNNRTYGQPLEMYAEEVHNSDNCT